MHRAQTEVSPWGCRSVSGGHTGRPFCCCWSLQTPGSPLCSSLRLHLVAEQRNYCTWQPGAFREELFTSQSETWWHVWSGLHQHHPAPPHRQNTVSVFNHHNKLFENQTRTSPGPVQDPSRTRPGSSNFYVSGLTYSPYFQLLRATLETILTLYEQIRTDLDQDLKGTWTEPSWTSDDSCRTLNTVWNTRCLFSSLMWRLVWMYVCDK